MTLLNIWDKILEREESEAMGISKQELETLNRLIDKLVNGMVVINTTLSTVEERVAELEKSYYSQNYGGRK